MAFLGYFTQFRIAVLARLLRDIYNFSNRNSSVGRAADLIYTCQVRCHGFDSRCFPHI